ncbi:MAG: alkyl sulfatase dimerization domain-containing protein [Actinomycetota bacterium]
MTAPNPSGSLPPTPTTIAANQAVEISFDDPGDRDRANRGLIAQIPDGRVTVGDHVVWDVAGHAFVNESDAPDSVHPALWRQAQLNTIHGLFEVADGVWQVRGYDIANITFMATDDGWLIIDPLTNSPSAAAALQLANDTLGARPVRAVIYTHSHRDHYGGVLGVTSRAEVEAGEVEIIAPDGFMREVVNEFVIGGPIMGRRSVYQFGIFLPPGPLGHVDCGLGSTMGLAQSDLVGPTIDITETGQELDIGGLRVVFQNTPDAEAPSEMNFHFPDKRLLCMAENCTHTLHNLYPIRGAQIRDALAWSKYIQEAMDLWGASTDTMFASHHWPRFGADDVAGFLTLQRDVYRWLHDQTMRLAANGSVPTEISAELSLPAEFDQSHVQGFYGTVSHNAKSVYTRYLGWYDGNPANLDPLPPVDAGTRYVEFMGGADAVLAKAQTAFDDGDYRWVAQVVNHVVFADPSNRAARELQAAALEQLGYRSESATWRNAYLMGARELRHGSPQGGRIRVQSESGAMTPEQIMDTIGVRYLPRPDATPHTINWEVGDLGESHVIGVGRSALHHRPNVSDPEAVATLHATRQQVILAVDEPAILEDLSIDGDRSSVQALFEGLDEFTPAALIEP